MPQSGVTDIEDIVSSHDVGVNDRLHSKHSVAVHVNKSRHKQGYTSNKRELEHAEGDSYIPGERKCGG